ncbi:lysophospholipid acyltransferase family protein [Algisphaera agarilytica]|uniref:KDO2-lipid IV(A) lauroyltransferase n=1 Tax=Algisphaera agarilytica TaxID=1385975 RepID=A0A7X0H8R4_9BACT|nr:lysophospholipid acyltransferase family protein [Algisphaera agarilytica]MBB6430176.1 KDO2-lipid IV(A) lauroyltransferase [Algisphaera agarilytica]
MNAPDEPTTQASPPPALGQRLNDFWLSIFFGLARRTPWLLKLSRPLFVSGAWHAASSMRHAVRANLRRVLGAQASRAEVDRVGKSVVASFYDFVCEIGANHDRSFDELLSRIVEIEGKEPFLAERKNQRGAILVTAHFGNFEVGLAAMREIEERVHVVFQRDQQSRFERIRSELHRNLGIIETPIDDGMASWLALRDALQDNAVVMLQGDRVMPGQRGLDVPFFDGHLSLPIGPAKLAMMTGAPLIPVFAVRVPAEKSKSRAADSGEVRIVLGEPIEVPDAGAVESATLAVGRAIEQIVDEHPEQWHVLHHAFVEDAAE